MFCSVRLSRIRRYELEDGTILKILNIQLFSTQKEALPRDEEMTNIEINF